MRGWGPVHLVLEPSMVMCKARKTEMRDSGRRAYVQGGSQLRKFMKTCLLDRTKSTVDDAGKTCN